MALACSSDSTIGTMTPRAPRSSERASQVYSPRGTRTIDEGKDELTPLAGASNRIAARQRDTLSAAVEGENIRVTAFFSDIEGFSTMSERLKGNPKQLMRLLNRYLSAVTPVLTGQGACIDKYIGDAVVALFGAPVRHVDHAYRACVGALYTQTALDAFRADLKKEGLPDINTRIGLNTDVMLVGNIGSEQLLDYTPIGASMNLPVGVF